MTGDVAGLSGEDVQEIVQLLDDLAATELYLRTRHYTLSVRRDGPDGEWVQATSAQTEPRLLDPAPEQAAAPPAPVAAGGGADGGGDGDAEVADGLVAVRTPLAGTFYRAPKPGAEPFVEVGSRVEEDTVVGIVETMKLMNSVYAGVRGQVAEICLDNAADAERGAALLRITPEQQEWPER